MRVLSLGPLAGRAKAVRFLQSLLFRVLEHTVFNPVKRPQQQKEGIK
jgi:hypothetical protein